MTHAERLRGMAAVPIATAISPEERVALRAGADALDECERTRRDLAAAGKYVCEEMAAREAAEREADALRARLAEADGLGRTAARILHDYDRALHPGSAGVEVHALAERMNAFLAGPPEAPPAPAATVPAADPLDAPVTWRDVETVLRDTRSVREGFVRLLTRVK